MARYLLTGKIYRGDRIVQAGEIIEMADDIAPAPCMLRIADRVAEPESGAEPEAAPTEPTGEPS